MKSDLELSMAFIILFNSHLSEASVTNLYDKMQQVGSTPFHNPIIL